FADGGLGRPAPLLRHGGDVEDGDTSDAGGCGGGRRRHTTNLPSRRATRHVRGPGRGEFTPFSLSRLGMPRRSRVPMVERSAPSAPPGGSPWPHVALAPPGTAASRRAAV